MTRDNWPGTPPPLVPLSVGKKWVGGNVKVGLTTKIQVVQPLHDPSDSHHWTTGGNVNYYHRSRGSTWIHLHISVHITFYCYCRNVGWAGGALLVIRQLYHFYSAWKQIKHHPNWQCFSVLCSVFPYPDWFKFMFVGLCNCIARHSGLHPLMTTLGDPKTNWEATPASGWREQGLQ